MAACAQEAEAAASMAETQAFSVVFAAGPGLPFLMASASCCRACLLLK